MEHHGIPQRKAAFCPIPSYTVSTLMTLRLKISKLMYLFSGGLIFSWISQLIWFIKRLPNVSQLEQGHWQLSINSLSNVTFADRLKSTLKLHLVSLSHHSGTKIMRLNSLVKTTHINPLPKPHNFLVP